MSNKIKIFLFCLLSLLFIGCDRLTKDLVKEHLMNKEPVSYLHDAVRLQYVENTGAALSLGDQLPETTSFWLLSILPLAALLILFAYTIKNVKKINLLKIFLSALIFAGGIGNIIDRVLFDRHVPDFMNIGIHQLRTGIFNVADLYITAGVIGVLVSAIKKPYTFLY